MNFMDIKKQLRELNENDQEDEIELDKIAYLILHQYDDEGFY